MINFKAIQRYRAQYSDAQLQEIENKLGKSLEEILEDYINKTLTEELPLESYTMVWPNVVLLRDVLITEVESSLEMSLVLGRTPNRAYAIAHNYLFKCYQQYKK
jgi:hypothetical protein